MTQTNIHTGMEMFAEGAVVYIIKYFLKLYKTTIRIRNIMTISQITMNLKYEPLYYLQMIVRDVSIH